MAEYLGPSTTNQADVIATMDGRIMPGGYDGTLSDKHAKLIHNDPFDHYGDYPVDEMCS